MTTAARDRVLDAAKKALRVRAESGANVGDPVDVYRIATGLGLQVWFADIGSMEGVYSRTAECVILSSLRPRGRQRFTCAHEIGHHVYGDGDQFDELTDGRSEQRRGDPKEHRADVFAGQLLMPKSAVMRGFTLREADCRTCAAEQVYGVACWLGVGYTTLVHHMHLALRVIDRPRAEQLNRVKLPTIRGHLLGESPSAPLIAVDCHWHGSIDGQVGDCLLLPPSTTAEGACVRVLRQTTIGTVLIAESPGLARISGTSFDGFRDIRICRKEFVGRLEYRFEQEASDCEGATLHC